MLMCFMLMCMGAFELKAGIFGLEAWSSWCAPWRQGSSTKLMPCPVAVRWADRPFPRVAGTGLKMRARGRNQIMTAPNTHIERTASRLCSILGMGSEWLMPTRKWSCFTIYRTHASLRSKIPRRKQVRACPVFFQFCLLLPTKTWNFDWLIALQKWLQTLHHTPSNIVRMRFVLFLDGLVGSTSQLSIGKGSRRNSVDACKALQSCLGEIKVCRNVRSGNSHPMK